eukprot:gnl/TRDRNA2_/TRDRNA2_162456_c0_seq1.p1 gnl/TRDRNA2_/TRDRNA2_162456_c0~~gnl/TRDRNA2_/TRDRNA2_162456_c0_seq1.p1  ORF type:complete len:230 (+),score=23.10 gnl/TRDRNA2_/TRDRNA2_162456_c0_seq1:140-829(+)
MSMLCKIAIISLLGLISQAHAEGVAMPSSTDAHEMLFDRGLGAWRLSRADRQTSRAPASSPERLNRALKAGMFKKKVRTSFPANSIPTELDARYSLDSPPASPEQSSAEHLLYGRLHESPRDSLDAVSLDHVHPDGSTVRLRGLIEGIADSDSGVHSESELSDGGMSLPESPRPHWSLAKSFLAQASPDMRSIPSGMLLCLIASSGAVFAALHIRRGSQALGEEPLLGI